MSAQHYIFAHVYLPQLVHTGEHVFGILSNPENQDFLHNYWDGVPRHHSFVPICQGHRQNLTSANPLFSPAFMDTPDEYERIIPPTGLQYSVHWIGGAHTVFLITFPPPTSLGEAYFAVITTSPKIEYFTLERGVNNQGQPRTVFCGWTKSSHLNFGDGPPLPANADLFLQAVCRRLGVPETIEAPLREQLQGARKKGLPEVINLGNMGGMSAEDEAYVADLTAQGEAAAKARRYDEAENCYRAVFDKRIEVQGPSNVSSFLSLPALISVLLRQNKFDEAEEICRLWCTWCRRYRSPGHQELFLATQILVQVLMEAGKTPEALQLLEYRVEFFRQMRGKDSHQHSAAARDHSRGPETWLIQKMIESRLP